MPKKRDHPVKWPKAFAPGAQTGAGNTPKRKASTKQTNKPNRS